MYKKVIVICGMPRSGTSWLGQILDSSPDVAFRLEPLFSYRFKNVIDIHSRAEEINEFLKQVYLTDDEFILQKQSRVKGVYCNFNKETNPGFLVLKTTRHHHLLENYLNLIDNIEIISIIRHPCAVINSWIKTEREFKSKGCTINNDWRSGRCRKTDPGEYWGFDDWLFATKLHMELSKKFKNFNIVKYSDLIKNTEDQTRKIFKNLSIQFEDQTRDFLYKCHNSHNDDPYSVFKDKKVQNKWKEELDAHIAQEIVLSTKALNLESFLI